VLPVLNKIVENCLTKQIQQYFEKYNILTEKQFGFRRKRGCDHAIAATGVGFLEKSPLDSKKKCVVD
jgi:hypothetical protein